MKKLLSLLLILSSLLLLCACLGPVSLDEYGYVISIGIDPGADKKWYFTFVLQRELAETDTQNEGGASILSEQADTFDDAVTAVEARAPYSLSFSRTAAFIFGREAAEQGAASVLRELSFDSLKIRASAAVIVASGTAKDFIGGLSANNDSNISKIQTAVMLDSRKTGRVTVMSAARFFESCETGAYGFCAPLGVSDPDVITDMSEKKSEADGKDPLESTAPNAPVGGLSSYLSGTALFDGEYMTGVLDREQTMYLNLANGEFNTGTVTLETAEGEFTFVVTLLSMRRRLLSDPPEHVEISLSLSAAVHKAPYDADIALLDRIITCDLARELESRMLFVAALTKKAGCDALRMGQMVLLNSFGEAPIDADELRLSALKLEPCFSVAVINAESGAEGGR